MRNGGVSETLSKQASELSGDPAVRRLAYSDLPAVISIERRSFPSPWSLAMFVLELSKPSGICLAAISGEELLGYLVCSRYDRVWHVMNVAVAPERRREGIASALLRQLLEETRGDARRGYTLEVRVSNVGAISLYERFGFRPKGVRRGYYQAVGGREDAAVLKLPLRTRRG